MVAKQIEYIGEGALSRVREIFNETKAKRIFLVTGKDSYVTSGAQRYFEGIKEYADIFHFNNFSSLSLCEDVQRGVELYRVFDPDLVVAVGGGSVMDMAKAVNILAAQRGPVEGYITGEKKIDRPGRDLVAIPTTSGSGSEATSFAVVYKDGFKYSLCSEYILPRFSIVDSKLTFSISKDGLIPGAFDALSQSIESYWSNQSDDESKRNSRQSLELILKNIVSAVKDKDGAAMANMSLAAHQAGKAINKAKTTACHAMSYGLTYYFKVPHGIAAAIFLPSVYSYNSKVDLDSCHDSRGLEYAQSVFSDLNNLFGCPDSERTARKIKDLLASFNVINLRSFGIKESDLPFLTQQINIERLDNNPRLISEADIYSFYKENL